MPEQHDVQPPRSHSHAQTHPPRPRSSVWLSPWFSLLLVLLLALMVGTLAYQAPANDTVAIGWIGDQLFLDASAGLRQDAVERGDFYADTLTPDSPTGRSRWTRQHARVTLPNVGTGFDVSIALLVQGWPDDVLVYPRSVVHDKPYQSLDDTPPPLFQPTVTLRADGTVIGVFNPTTRWDEYTFHMPAHLRTGHDLVLDLSTSAVFTDTQRGPDARPKGVRLAGITIRSKTDGIPPDSQATPAEQFQAMRAQVLPPSWPAVLSLALVSLLCAVVVRGIVRSGPLTFVLTAILTGVCGVGLALLRLWMGAALSVAVVVLLLAILVIWHRAWLRLLRHLVWHYGQGRALNYGLMTAAFVWLAYALARGSILVRSFLTESGVLQDMFPDSILAGVVGAGLLALVLVLGRDGLPRLAALVVGWLQRPIPALVVLGGAGLVWLGYEAWVVARLPYVGHADYADNAVVARNLLAGRGWVVDYVTQFYQLYDSVTRPQETWPLLQPVWIVPFFAAFGPEAWAAKLPNLLFNAVLLVLVFAAGALLWDRRVGLTAAVLVLTNHLFFTLTIYATSDLAFVVFVTAGLLLLYRAMEAGTACQPSTRLLVGSGVLTGLMMLQKPSGAVIAVGMGVWLLARGMQHAYTRTTAPLQQTPGMLAVLPGVAWQFARWAVPALLVLSPYMVRNMVLFDAPVYSTERYDAWVLGYRGTSEEAWNDIYRVYAPELGGAGVPDRSWILRWGFDQTIEKIVTQVRAVRDYLLPAWDALPTTNTPIQFQLLSANEHKNLFPPPGAWLAFLGVVAGLRSRRRLLGLLTLAFVPYALFLVLYWHANEERYWLMVMPWLALFAAWVIWAGYDRLETIAGGLWRPLGLILVVLAVVSIISPSWPIISSKVQQEPHKWAPDIVAYTWLREHTPPDAVVMTRNPWQLNWHAERPAVMIPNTSDRDMLLFLARSYGVEYIVFDSLQRVKSDAARLLAPLITAQGVQVGDTVDGFVLVYASPTPDNRVLIYRLPPPGDGDTDAPTESGG